MKVDIKKLFGDISQKALIYMLGVLGIFLLMIPSCRKDVDVKENLPSENFDYCSMVEEKLENILPQIEGVGNVNVMVTAENYGEILLAKDENTESEKTIVLNQKGGGEETKVVEEKYPRIRGVVIAADGGNNDRVKNEITEAVRALLGVEAHKIKVFERTVQNGF